MNVATNVVTNVVSVDPRTDSLWCQLVQQVPTSVFHSPDWMKVLSDTYGWEPSARIVLDDQGQPQAGIPFFRISDMLGERTVALPFSDYCDPLVNDEESWRILIDQLIAEHHPVSVRCLHNDLPLGDTRFTLAKQAKWHRLDLRPDLEALWKAMHDSTHTAPFGNRSGKASPFGWRSPSKSCASFSRCI